MHFYGVYILYSWMGLKEGRTRSRSEAGAVLPDSSPSSWTWEGFLCEAREGDSSMYTMKGPRVPGRWGVLPKLQDFVG